MLNIGGSPNSASGNTLLVIGSLTGIAFILVGGVVALAYTDGKNASIVLPVLLGLVGPLIMAIIAMAKSVENGAKADTAIQQNAQLESLIRDIPSRTTPVTATPPSIIVNVPPTAVITPPTEAPPSGPA